jgi:CBS domain-containing protein
MEARMKIREVMSENPVCCLPSDSAQAVAQIMCDHNVGLIPVVSDQQSKQLVGVITDRDLCCNVVAAGLDPKTTAIENHITQRPFTCRDGENIEKCERLMQEHQVRRVPVVDANNSVIGIVAQADLALKEKPDRLSKTMAEISKPASSSAA